MFEFENENLLKADGFDEAILGVVKRRVLSRPSYTITRSALKFSWSEMG